MRNSMMRRLGHVSVSFSSQGRKGGSAATHGLKTIELLESFRIVITSILHEERMTTHPLSHHEVQLSRLQNPF
jgi:hypothetical protein